MIRWWPALVALPIALYAAYVWAQVIGPEDMIAVTAIGLAVAAGKPIGMPRRRR